MIPRIFVGTKNICGYDTSSTGQLSTKQYIYIHKCKSRMFSYGLIVKAENSRNKWHIA